MWYAFQSRSGSPSHPCWWLTLFRPIIITIIINIIIITITVIIIIIRPKASRVKIMMSIRDIQGGCSKPLAGHGQQWIATCECCQSAAHCRESLHGCQSLDCTRHCTLPDPTVTVRKSPTSRLNLIQRSFVGSMWLFHGQSGPSEQHIQLLVAEHSDSWWGPFGHRPKCRVGVLLGC